MSARLAVVLAAGSGMRLGDHGDGRPKGLLRVGARPIIEESMQRLRANGVQRCLLVTGFAADDYRDWAASHRGLEIQLLHNPDFAGTGSLHTLALAADLIDEDCLLLESDLIYESRALRVVQVHPAPDLVLLSGRTDSGDEVYVTTDPQGYLTGMSKQRAELTDPVAGELVGISRLTVDTCRAVQRYAAGLPAGDRERHYETDGLVTVARERPILCHRVDDLVWSEIDTLEHLQRVRAIIYPRLDPAGSAP